MVKSVAGPGILLLTRRPACKAYALPLAHGGLFHTSHGLGADRFPVFARQFGLLRLQSLAQQCRKLLLGLLLLVVADQLANVLACGAVPAGGNLLVDLVLQRFR